MRRKTTDDRDSVTRTTTIFGAPDGLVATVIGFFIAAGLGVAASQFLSDPVRNLRLAMLMGAATSVTIIVPAVLWIFSSGSAAVVASCLITLVFAGLVSHARPGGWSTWLQNYGVLVGVGAIAAIARRLTSFQNAEQRVNVGPFALLRPRKVPPKSARHLPHS
jgi:hypothetical protein